MTGNDNPSPGTPTSTLNLQPHFKALTSLTFESIIRHHHTHSSFVSLPVDCISGIVLTVKLVPQLRVKTQKPRSNNKIDICIMKIIDNFYITTGLSLSSPRDCLKISANNTAINGSTISDYDDVRVQETINRLQCVDILRTSILTSTL